MEIYTFHSSYNTVMNIIYALIAIALGVVSFILIRFFIRQVKAYHQSELRFPRVLAAFLIVICFVPIVGTVLCGDAFIKSISYDIKMARGNAYYIEGDIELVSYEESYYRGTFMGYNVVLTFDEKIIAPSNTFSTEMINYFKSDENLIVQYGEIKNDGVYIWSICTTKK